jgi:hypothetical protein
MIAERHTYPSEAVPRLLNLIGLADSDLREYLKEKQTDLIGGKLGRLKGYRAIANHAVSVISPRLHVMRVRGPA